MRQFSHDLKPAILDDLGLVPALTWLSWQRDRRLEHRFKFSWKRATVSFSSELMLFRIAQEAMRNIIKHAAFNHAELYLHLNKDRVSLRIIDRGNGFDVPDDLGKLPEIGKLGLIGIQEMARLLNGLMSVKSPNKEVPIISFEVLLLNRVQDESKSRLNYLRYLLTINTYN